MADARAWAQLGHAAAAAPPSSPAAQHQTTLVQHPPLTQHAGQALELEAAEREASTAQPNLRRDSDAVFMSPAPPERSARLTTGVGPDPDPAAGRLGPQTRPPDLAPAPASDLAPSEKDVKLAQKLGQLQPFTVVFPQEGMGQLAPFGPT